MSDSAGRDTEANDAGATHARLYLAGHDDGRVSLVEQSPAQGKNRVADFVAGPGGVVVHPGSSSVPLYLNGQPFDSPTALAHGDRIKAGALLVSFAEDGRGGSLYLQEGDSNATLPPGEEQAAAQTWRLAPDHDAAEAQKVTDPATEITAQRIDPGHYAKSVETSKTQRQIRPIPIAIAAAFAVLGVLGWFMFTARSVQFVVEPIPEHVGVEGSWFSFELGGRFLLRPGQVTLVAEKEGYYRLSEEVQIGDASNQEFSFELTRLPDIYRVSTAPVDNAIVFVDGVESGMTPLEGLEIEAGERTVRVSAERYLDEEQLLSVVGGGNEEILEVVLEPAWAVFDIRSEPAGATVTVDDVEIGTTPLEAELLQGTRQVELNRGGYKTWFNDFEIVAGVADSVDVKLIRSDGLASIRSRPPGASVTINGQYRGRTPLSLKLAPSQGYSVSFSLAGYEGQTRQLAVRSDQDASLSATLAPVLGTVFIASEPDGADIKIDGEPMGKSNRRVELSARPHTVEFSKPGYAPQHINVTPRPGFEQQVVAQLKTLEQARWDSIPQIIKTAAGQELSLIRSGEVSMGAPRRQAGRRSNEIERQARLSRAFYLGLREVTNAEYRRFDAEHSSGVIKGDSLNQNTHPVVEVDWEQAASYCNWLSARDGLPAAYKREDGKLVAVQPMNTGYRLPTEAEWAYAERHSNSGMRTVYPWGDGMPPSGGAGNFADQSARNVVKEIISDYDDGYAVTAPTGKFNASDLGFFDLAGNASEWMHDYYSVDPAQTGRLTVDPAGPAKGEYHVIRGSSWTTGGVTGLRVSYRDYGAEGRNDLGFRIARYLE